MSHDVYSVDASMHYVVLAYVIGAFVFGAVLGFVIGRKGFRK